MSDTKASDFELLNHEKSSPLREAMSKLDYALPDYVFDSDEGQDIPECIENDDMELSNTKSTNFVLN